jgi:hypothetical protein
MTPYVAAYPQALMIICRTEKALSTWKTTMPPISSPMASAGNTRAPSRMYAPSARPAGAYQTERASNSPRSRLTHASRT